MGFFGCIEGFCLFLFFALLLLIFTYQIAFVVQVRFRALCTGLMFTEYPTCTVFRVILVICFGLCDSFLHHYTLAPLSMLFFVNIMMCKVNTFATFYRVFLPTCVSCWCWGLLVFVP